MAQKVKMECPRCDGKGVIPQYFYNRKGICFLCWGSGYIMATVPSGKSAEEYAKELGEKERQHLKNNPPKVDMPDADKHRNKDYFKDTKTKLKPQPKSIMTDEQKQKMKESLRNMYHDFSVEKLKGMLTANGELQKKEPHNEVAKLSAEVINELIAEKEAKTKPSENDRIGRIVKGTRGKPDIEIIDTAGSLNIGKFTNSKTGETNYTVFPEGQIAREDWDKFKKDMKDVAGGGYSRFMAKPIFDTDPSEKLKEYVAGAGSQYDDGSGDAGDDDASKRRAERKRIRELQRQADAIYMDNQDYSVAGWQNVRKQIEALDDFPDKAKALSDVDDAIKRAKENEESDARQKVVTDILSKYPSMNQAEIGHLEGMLNELKALPQSSERDTAIGRAEDWIQLKKDAMAKAKRKGEAFAKYDKEVLQKRRDLVSKGVTYKDTELGKKVSDLAGGTAISDKETAIKVGNMLREHMLAQLNSEDEEIVKMEARLKEMKSKETFASSETFTLGQEIREAKNGRRTKIVSQMLHDIREMGDNTPVELIHLKGDSNKAIKKRVSDASKYFPKEWVEMSNTQPIRVKNEPKRAYHMAETPPSIITGEPSYGLLGLGAKESETTIVHELGHRMEMVNSRLQSVIFDYLETSTEGQKLANIYSWTTKEKYKPKKDGTPWVNNYIGKDYIGRDGKRRATEVLTMGLECLYFNTHKGTGYASADEGGRDKFNAEHFDAEFMNLILGVLAGA